MAWTNLSFAYGSILTSTKMTQLYDNIVTVAPNFASGKFGTLYNYQEILATNSAWAPTSGTHSLIVCCIGAGGGGAGGGTTYLAEGGGAGAVKWAEVDSVGGTFVAIVGVGGVGGSGGVGSVGGTTSFSTVCSADGGLGGVYVNIGAAVNLNGEACYGPASAASQVGSAAAAPANSGAGGGAGASGGGVGGGNGGSGRILVWEFI